MANKIRPVGPDGMYSDEPEWDRPAKRKQKRVFNRATGKFQEPAPSVDGAKNTGDALQTLNPTDKKVKNALDKAGV